MDEILGALEKRAKHQLVFGPTAIRGLSFRAQTFVKSLGKARIHMDHQGQWRDETTSAYWRYAFFVVGLRNALGAECVSDIEQKSGLRFDQFIGQIVAWWFPQRSRMGLLRAVAHRLDTHGVALTLHWNQDRYVPPRFVRPPFSLQVIATLLGFGFGLFVYHQFHWDQVFAFLCAAAGYVGSELYRRSTLHAYCGDGLCRSRVRSHACSFCGAKTVSER